MVKGSRDGAVLVAIVVVLSAACSPGPGPGEATMTSAPCRSFCGSTGSINPERC